MSYFVCHCEGIARGNLFCHCEGVARGNLFCHCEGAARGNLLCHCEPSGAAISFVGLLHFVRNDRVMGLLRRFAPRNDRKGVAMTGNASILVMTYSINALC